MNHHQLASLARRYHDDIHTISSHCREPAQLADVLDGYAIIGALRCGLTIWITDNRLRGLQTSNATNEEDTGPFISTLYYEGHPLALIIDGTLTEQLAAVATITDQQVADMMNGHWPPLPSLIQPL